RREAVCQRANFAGWLARRLHRHNSLIFINLRRGKWGSVPACHRVSGTVLARPARPLFGQALSSRGRNTDRHLYKIKLLKTALSPCLSSSQPEGFDLFPCSLPWARSEQGMASVPGIKPPRRAGLPVRAENLAGDCPACRPVLLHHLPVNRLAVVAGHATELAVFQLADLYLVVFADLAVPTRIDVSRLEEVGDILGRHAPLGPAQVAEQRPLHRVGADQA